MKTVLALCAVVCLTVACGKSDKPNAATKEGLKNVVGEEVSYTADNVTMKGYLAYDANQKGKRPAVLVVHEWWGHNDYARKRATMLAEMGYIALAVDMYGDGKTADHPGDAGKFATAVMKNAAGAKVRFLKAMETLLANPNADAANVAAIGYCFGGATVLNMARQGVDLKAVVSFHGSLATATPATKGSVKGRLLVCNGAADTFVSEQDIANFKKEMDAAGATYTFKAYADAIHGFTNPAADSLGKKFGMALAYNAKADEESWNDMKALFKEVLK